LKRAGVVASQKILEKVIVLRGGRVMEPFEVLEKLYDPRSRIYDELRQMHSDEMKKRWAGPWGDIMQALFKTPEHRLKISEGLKTFYEILSPERRAEWSENISKGERPARII